MGDGGSERRGINLNYPRNYPRTSFPVSSPGETREEGATRAVSLVTRDFFAGGLGLCQYLYDSLTLSASQGHPGAQLLGVPFI